MNAPAAAWALDAPVSWGAAKFLLVVIASNSDADHECVLPVTQLARIMATDRRVTYRRLAWLIEKGWLESRRNWRRSSVLVLCDPRASVSGALAA